jgi:hypothetical protein
MAHHLFNEDFWMQAEGWTDKSQVYDIGIVRLAQAYTSDPVWDNTRDVCMLVWRYGKAIPASGDHRISKEGHPIYQRIRTFTPRSSSELRESTNSAEHSGDNFSDSEEGSSGSEEDSSGSEEDDELVIDWSLAEVVTIALE